MKKISAFALLVIPLAGCVGFSSDRAKINNAQEIISYETSLDVKVGDSLEKLKKAMGEPTSQGVDDRNQPFLRYVMVEQKSKATTVQILGFIHASAYNYPTGSETQVFYDQGVITEIIRKQYVSEPGVNSQ